MKHTPEFLEQQIAAIKTQQDEMRKGMTVPIHKAELARLRAIEAAAREVAAWEPTDLRDNFNTKRYKVEVQALRAALEAKP